MAKETDYKRLWRSAKDDNLKLSKEIDRLESLIRGYVDIIEKIKSGQIKIDLKK